MWELMLPEFRGADCEDPVTFIDRCEQVLKSYNVPVVCWPSVVGSKLTNDAKSWARAVSDDQPNWGDFVKRLYSRYNGESLLVSLKSKLYGEGQKVGQLCEPFIRRKARMFARLVPNEERDKAIPIIIELMDKKIRPYFRCSPPKTIEELISKGNQLEMDLKIEGKLNVVISSASDHLVAGEKSHSGAIVCFSCGAPGHYSRNCIQGRRAEDGGQMGNPLGNENGSGQSRAWLPRN
jgi:Zinc knuckle